MTLKDLIFTIAYLLSKMVEIIPMVCQGNYYTLGSIICVFKNSFMILEHWTKCNEINITSLRSLKDISYPKQCK